MNLHLAGGVDAPIISPGRVIVNVG